LRTQLDSTGSGRPAVHREAAQSEEGFAKHGPDRSSEKRADSSDDDEPIDIDASSLLAEALGQKPVEDDEERRREERRRKRQARYASLRAQEDESGSTGLDPVDQPSHEPPVPAPASEEEGKPAPPPHDGTPREEKPKRLHNRFAELREQEEAKREARGQEGEPEEDQDEPDERIAQNALALFGNNDVEGAGNAVAPAPAVFDMFAEEDNIPLPAKGFLGGDAANGFDRGEGGGLQDNWDDAEGYYTFRVNEVLNSRYQVINSLGRGVFSSVLRAYDRQKSNEIVAVKVIRAHDIMYQAGMKELQILRELTEEDAENRRHCIRILDHFEYREHLCIVMEAMHLNLRKLVKKYGKGEGINLKAVRSYGKQLFVALRHISRCGLVHADLKPDNMVVNDGLNLLKICDFGSAYRLHELPELDGTPYVVSRYYRAPEIVLGYGPKCAAMDIWSAAVSLAEMFTGKLLFTGRDNNALLRSIMDLCGKVPKRILSRSNFREDHFDERGSFLSREIDRVTGGEVTRSYSNLAPSRDLLQELSSSLTPQVAEKLKPELVHFKDFLEKCLNLDPSRRMTAEQALSHPFLKAGGQGA